jgi:hypothetical protein
MPQHVDMNRERQLSGLAGTLDHASNAHPAKGLATLIELLRRPQYQRRPPHRGAVLTAARLR